MQDKLNTAYKETKACSMNKSTNDSPVHLDKNLNKTGRIPTKGKNNGLLSN